MTIDLTAFEPAIRAHADDWEAAGATWSVKPISPNYGKPVTLVEFETGAWLAGVIVWETGELDLDAGRKSDGWLVSKHYDLRTDQEFEAVFAEVLALLRDGEVPPSAMTSWLNGG
jgi:hypothetical protein